MPSRVLPLVGLFTGLSLVLPLVAQEQAEPELTPLEQGRKLLGKRDFSAAEQVLREFVARNPAAEDAAEASLLHGRSLVGLDRLDDARRSFEWLLSRHPASPHAAAALEGMMQFHEQRRNATGVQEARQRLLREHPGSDVTARVWMPVANEAFNRKNYREAVSIYTALESKLNANQRGQLQAARILSEDGTDPAPVLESARNSMRERQYEPALVLLRVLRERFPSHPAALEAAVMEGQSLASLGGQENAEKARDIWQQVVRQTGAATDVMELARWELIRINAGPLNDIDTSLKWCDQAIADSVAGEFRHQQAMYSKAWLLWVHKRHQQALEAEAEAEAGAPWPEPLRMKLGLKIQWCAGISTGTWQPTALTIMSPRSAKSTTVRPTSTRHAGC